MRYMTLLGQLVDVDADPRLERFYDSILASPNGGAAEDLLYGPANPLAAGLELRDGLPVWTAAVLRDPRWTFLLDAVARCRAACGELDVAAVMRAATWSTAEAARSLGCSEVNVRALIASGALPAVTAAGRHMLDRAAVEAYDGVRQAGHRGTRVPALYVRAGTRGDARLVVVVLGEDGRELAGELLGSADDVEELVFSGWAEAVFLGGKGDKARALHVRPLHGRAAAGFGLEGLEVRGRWEILDRTNNRDEAAGLLAAIRGKASAARRALRQIALGDFIARLTQAIRDNQRRADYLSQPEPIDYGVVVDARRGTHLRPASHEDAARARELADPATGEHVDQHGHLVRLEPPDAAEKGGAP